MYEDGNGVDQNFEETIKWYRKAAEQGDAAAQNNLGHIYRQERVYLKILIQLFTGIEKLLNKVIPAKII